MISVPKQSSYILVHEPACSGPIQVGYILLLHQGDLAFGLLVYRDNLIGMLATQHLDIGREVRMPAECSDLFAKKLGDLRRRLERKR